MGLCKDDSIILRVFRIWMVWPSAATANHVIIKLKLLFGGAGLSRDYFFTKFTLSTRRVRPLEQLHFSLMIYIKKSIWASMSHLERIVSSPDKISEHLASLYTTCRVNVPRLALDSVVKVLKVWNRLQRKGLVKPGLQVVIVARNVYGALNDERHKRELS